MLIRTVWNGAHPRTSPRRSKPIYVRIQREKTAREHGFGVPAGALPALCKPLRPN